ncbi:VOC family protein [Echinicola sediminis]
MLASSKAFSSFSVNNLSTAKTFYSEKLGLKVTEHPMGLLELHTSGNEPIIVYPKPDHQPAAFTVLNFYVPDLEKVVDGLIAKGIKFEQYSGEIQTDQKGISRSEHGPDIAWFKDPAGNIISVIKSS